MAIVVDNKGFYDANVYVYADGSVVRRLGTVDGNSARRFALVGRQFAPGGTVSLYAKTIAEGRVYWSGEFSISDGAGLKWTLESQGHEWLIPLSAAH